MSLNEADNHAAKLEIVNEWLRMRKYKTNAKLIFKLCVLSGVNSAHNSLHA